MMGAYNKRPDRLPLQTWSQNDTVALKKCCSVGDIQSELLPWVSAAISSLSSGFTQTGHSLASLLSTLATTVTFSRHGAFLPASKCHDTKV